MASGLSFRIIALLLAFAALFAAQPAAANFNDFLGSWANEDPNTGNVVKLVVGGSAGNPTIQLFGACSPNPCDWGVQPATAYGGSASANLASDTRALVATIVSGHATTVVVLQKRGSDKLWLQTFRHFTDGSGRTAYMASESFQRAAGSTGLGAEDCIPIYTSQVQVVQQGGQARITDGHSILMNFGSNQVGAVQALGVIFGYGLDRQCFVGRPDFPVSYYLTNGQIPRGQLPGEDCIGFTPANLSVTQAQGRWKVVDGSHWIFDFGNRADLANRMAEVMRHYGATKVCYVGRPNPPMIYLRK